MEEQAGKRAKMTKSDVLKFAGLVAFLVITCAIVALMWPYIADIFTEGGVDCLVERVQNAGAAGVFILLGMQLLQIIVAFIPGEVVQLAAGLMYGPWLGALIVLVGCIVSSAIIFSLVHFLGAPFVRDMVPTKHLDKFSHFEETGKLNIVVFILFLIPGMPKDVFTYLVPLTDMRLKSFLILTNTARIPGILASTYAAAGFASGDMASSIVIIAVVAAVAVVGIVFKDRIIDFFARHKEK